MGATRWTPPPPAFLRKHALLLTSLGPPVALALACWPAQATGSLEPVSLRPPPGSHRRVLLPAQSPSQPTVSAPPLGPSEASCATRWPVPPLSSPEFECPRPRHHRSAAATRRQHLRSNHRRQSEEGEPNCLFPSLVCLSPPASPPSPPGARGWGIEGMVVKSLKLPGTRVLKDFVLFGVS
jgi:hypothetical protein